MKLSIITINLNNKDGLQCTINSVLSQSFSDYEWIIIDGDSNDGSRELIEQNARHLSYWVSEPDKGIFNAMNKGIKNAAGDWLLFLNSGDSLYESTTLEKLFCQQHNGDILYGNAVIIYPDGTKIHAHYPDSVSLHYFKWGVINHQATFFRNYVFKDHPYNEKYFIAGDWAYCFEAVCRGLKFTHIDQTIVYYDNSGISTNWNERHIREREDILETYIPQQLKPDMAILDELHKLRRRRSTSKLLDTSLLLCNRWDQLMQRIEKWLH